ncbi:hypothetical protein D3C75_795560 [compost metagenome]
MLQLVLLQQSFLRQDDVLKQLNIIPVGAPQRRILLTPHAEGDQIVEILIALDPVFPERGDGLFIPGKIPQVACAVLLVHLLPFAARPEQRFMMGGSHDNAVLFSMLRIGNRAAFAVQAEFGAPHRRPQIIPLQPEDQLKNLVIKLFIEIPERLGHPRAQ